MAGALLAPNREHLRYLVAYALRYGDTGAVPKAVPEDALRATADAILRHIERGGYVILQEPPPPLGTSGHGHASTLENGTAP